MLTQGKIALSAIMFVWLWPVNSAASPINESPNNVQQDVERIEITAKPTKQFYRERWYEAQDAFFEIYNQLTKNKAFHIKCKKRKQHAFTRLTERVCEANFVGDIRHNTIDRSSRMQSMRNPNVHLESKLGNLNKFKAMREEQAQQMVEMINKHPEIRAHFVALQTAKRQYDQYDNN